MFKFNHLNVCLKILFALLFNYFRGQVAFLVVRYNDCKDVVYNVSVKYQ